MKGYEHNTHGGKEDGPKGPEQMTSLNDPVRYTGAPTEPHTELDPEAGKAEMYKNTPHDPGFPRGVHGVIGVS